MSCGGCGSGRQYSSHSVRRVSRGGTRRRVLQEGPVVFSEREHGGYRLQVTSGKDEIDRKRDENSGSQHNQ